MIRITQLKLPIDRKSDDITIAAAKALKIKPQRISEYRIIKKSIDARKKNEIKYIYTVDVSIIPEGKNSEQDVIKHSRNVNVSLSDNSHYQFTVTGSEHLPYPPVVVGTGPAGLFCAWLLAKYGFQPIVIERGDEVSKRVRAVSDFWEGKPLNPECNVQFGEGGAGTFSDGKLNTMVKDPANRYPFVMETFVEHGAPSDILYLNKPHIGTDHLRSVVENMRKEIIRMGGEVHFNTRLTDIIVENGKLVKIELNHNQILPCEIMIPAIGHSARDTFPMLLKRGLLLTPKAFAVGVRIEHKQSMISLSQYGEDYKKLPPADYKLTHQTKTGRGVYSFCMCPGGYVVNASSEEGHLAVNGMSNYLRDGENANSAIVVTVNPEDFGNGDPLSGIDFQRKWERLAYQTGNGSVPVQLFGDLRNGRKSVTIGGITPNIKGKYQLSDLHKCIPEDIISSLIEGIQAFDLRLKGFADEEAVLSGVETRTSSPVRIVRDAALESNVKGVYPCGEGAGYAGGITSAAIDGIKVFEAIARRFRPDYE